MLSEVCNMCSSNEIYFICMYIYSTASNVIKNFPEYCQGGKEQFQI